MLSDITIKLILKANIFKIKFILTEQYFNVNIQI